MKRFMALMLVIVTLFSWAACAVPDSLTIISTVIKNTSRCQQGKDSLYRMIKEGY